MARNDDTRAHKHETEQEAARYRRAAEETLAQLEWCVNYLHRIRKPGIAEVIDKNRAFIRRRINRTD